MKKTTTSLVVLQLLLCVATARGQSGFRFLATGDLPYAKSQDVQYRQLLKQSLSEDFAFLMHVGDFKAQSMPCSDAEFVKIRNLFRAYPKPVVYTPGDNEWTDCHGVGSDPIERLAKIRQLFYQDKKTLRLAKLNVVAQSRQKKYATFVENYRFTKSNVMFIVAHVVGSGNNHRADHAPSMKEFAARSQANAAFLKESFAKAKAKRVKGVAVVIHANPNFEKASGPGFKRFQTTMREFLDSYKQPVVCIHGDTHYFRIDKPFKNKAGKTYLHFTRMEVFGSPNVAGVVVNVDPNDKQVFRFRPYYLSVGRNKR